MKNEEDLKTELMIIEIFRALKKMVIDIDDRKINEIERRLLEEMTIFIQNG